MPYLHTNKLSRCDSGRCGRTAQHHQGHNMRAPVAETEFLRSVPRQRDHEYAKAGEHNPHRDVGHVLLVLLSGLELEVSIVTG